MGHFITYQSTYNLVEEAQSMLLLQHPAADYNVPLRQKKHPYSTSQSFILPHGPESTLQGEQVRFLGAVINRIMSSNELLCELPLAPRMKSRLCGPQRWCSRTARWYPDDIPVYRNSRETRLHIKAKWQKEELFRVILLSECSRWWPHVQGYLTERWSGWYYGSNNDCLLIESFSPFWPLLCSLVQTVDAATQKVNE